MPNYYSDGAGDWFRTSDDEAVHKATVVAIQALPATATNANVVAAIVAKDAKVTQPKPASLYLRK